MRLPTALRDPAYLMQSATFAIVVACILLLFYVLLAVKTSTVWARREMSPLGRITMSVLSVLVVASSAGTYLGFLAEPPTRSGTPEAAAVVDPDARWVTDASRSEAAEQAYLVYGATLVSGPVEDVWVFDVAGAKKQCLISPTGPPTSAGTPAVLLCDGSEPPRLR